MSKSGRTGKVRNDERVDWGSARKLFRGNIAYVWHGALHATTVAASLESRDLPSAPTSSGPRSGWCLARGDYHWSHQPAWYAVRGKGHWTGDRKQTTLWTISSGGQDIDAVHGTQKPVECMRRPMCNNSRPGDIVYEPFLGSGTTLIAAGTNGRICRAVEIDPLYVDLAVRRWQVFTGKQAILQATGQAFEAVAAERRSRTDP